MDDETPQEPQEPVSPVPEPEPSPIDRWADLIGPLWGLVSTVALLYLAAHPDLLDALGYRVRLWWAYKQAPPNVARLRHMRALRLAGYYDADLMPAPAGTGQGTGEAEA